MSAIDAADHAQQDVDLAVIAARDEPIAMDDRCTELLRQDIDQPPP